jgi:DNA invertase Pin-like site-specific DNA recombinase
LERAGCYRVFTETASGARTDRPTLEQLLDQLRPGDTLVVWKLDRLGRSLRHLVDTVTGSGQYSVAAIAMTLGSAGRRSTATWAAPAAKLRPNLCSGRFVDDRPG